MEKPFRVFKNPWLVFKFLAGKGLLDSMPDEPYLRLMYRATVGRKPDFGHPATFSEKLQWLKLHNRQPEYVVMADKVKAKDYVAAKIGEEYIIPTLGVWESADDVDFDSLPDCFVIKCNHNSGKGMYICRDKSRMDAAKVREGLRRGLAENYWLHGREWPYRDVPRRIIAEKFMDDGSGTDLADYKFFCFGGEPRLCQVISDRSTDEKIDFYDMGWNRLIGLIGLNTEARNSDSEIDRPACFDDMKRCAGILAGSMPFSRIDFYCVGGRAYWGEITFFPASGFGRFVPDEWNEKIGEWVRI